MIIEKYYGETVEFKKGKWIKLGVTIKSDKNLSTSEEIKTHSRKLMMLGKKLIKNDIDELSKEK